MKKTSLILALCASIAMPVLARAESLADALASAYENSGLIAQNRALLRAADEDVAQAVSQLRPIIDWSLRFAQEYGYVKQIVSQGPVSTAVKSKLTGTSGNLTVTASLLLFDFGKTRAQIEAAKETVLATRQDLLSIEQQVLLRAVDAYLEVIRARRVVSLRSNNVRVLTEELRATMDRFEVGEVTRTDIAQSEARLAEARGNLSVAQGDLEASVAEYRAAVGRKPGDLSYPKDRPRVKGGEPAAMTVALAKNPDLLSAKHAVAAADLNISVAEALTKPTVSLFAQGTLEDSFDDKSYRHGGSFGVQATGPIYQGGRLASVRRQAISQRDSQIGRLYTMRSDVERGVSNAFARLDAAVATEKASQERVRAQQVAFEGVREEARLGARTTLDVLNAEQELLDARVSLVTATVEVNKAAYAVLYAMGELTVKELRLNAPTYDPAVYYKSAKTAPVGISPQGQKLDRILQGLHKK